MNIDYSSKIKFLPFYLLSILPMPVLYLLSDAVFVLIYYIIGYRKKVVMKNIRGSFPTKNGEEIKRISKDFYRHFCDTIFESIKRLTIGTNAIRKRLRIKNPELLESFINDRRNILFYTAHQGNWEWLTFMPIFFPYPSNTFFSPLKNKYFNELSQLMRERFGIRCVPSSKGYRTIIEGTRADTLTMNCIIGDQSPHAQSSLHWCHFLNRETAFFTGAEKIAKKTNPVVLFPYFKKVKRGYYELEFQLIHANPQELGPMEIVERYAKQLESAILRSPNLWLWSHNRWKLNEKIERDPNIKKSA
ncbi:lysophospholipid acyltransferase family protein [Flavobacteriaceae bacterium F89]|uniref:Lysophospholipid acyltransferase family protein n=1 Tax=Cerina litoralis TaxID=2874477 RepID=A0AAE3EV58_9FLAO|nr:lysophospholipid acyltransferase family protein [Cerina litoralis]MCG2461607.1 lysophospholipid acyltransferase family protein [Cerina litoralis]